MNIIYSKTRGFHFQTIKELAASWPQVKSHFNKNGFAILTTSDDTKQTALKTCRLFGKIQGHIRAPIDGVVDIRSESMGQNSTQIISNLTFTAHTDGAYLEGMAVTNGRVFIVGPPKMIALQCIQPAKEGGINYLIDGQKVLADLVQKHPDIALKLASLGSISICRDQYLIANAPIIRKMPTGLYAFRFNYDNDLYTTKEIMTAIKFFNQAYIQNKHYISYISLKEKEILIFDNHRLLHGRTAFSGDRFLRRIWIWDENLPAVFNPQGLPYFGIQGKDIEAFKRYQPYLPVELSFRTPKVETIPTGIKLEIGYNKKFSI